MARVKRGTTAHKRRANVLKQTKGFRWGRKSKYKLAKDALAHAGVYSFRDRKTKKRTFRRLWQVQISAALGDTISYSKFIAGLKKNKIEIDRKILSELGKERPEIFKKIVEKATS
ncbi:MAG TPA: 50S ribosomal protein L20 [Candidatus Wildermuthbacteria bacterium]|nr:50S ribosomal protein L20 [Candidatus Wildermuthbacteria bacterium]